MCNKKFYYLVEKWYKSNSQDNLDECLLYYLDNYIEEDGNVLFILKHILLTYPKQKAIDVIFFGIGLENK